MANIQTWLSGSVRSLERAGIGTARLDTLILLEDATGRNRAWLLAHPEFKISAHQVTKLEKLLKRRAAHEPLAYIRGKIEFYGHEFVLTPAVLQPRPESETMIDMLKVLVQKPQSRRRALRLADVGTGSGALGITAKLELPNLHIDLLDIDRDVLGVAQTNVDKFTLSISVTESDLLSNTPQNYDILLCNLPYVPDDFQINQAAMQEPRLAIFGGPDGLDVYRQLFKQIAELRQQPLYILTESLPTQHAALSQIAKQAGYRLNRSDDFIQLFGLAV